MPQLKFTLVARYIGREEYRAEGRVHRLTDEEILTQCDANNFGGYVSMRTNYTAYVTIYTD